MKTKYKLGLIGASAVFTFTLITERNASSQAFTCPNNNYWSCSTMTSTYEREYKRMLANVPWSDNQDPRCIHARDGSESIIDSARFAWFNSSHAAGYSHLPTQTIGLNERYRSQFGSFRGGDLNGLSALEVLVHEAAHWGLGHVGRHEAFESAADYVTDQCITW